MNLRIKILASKTTAQGTVYFVCSHPGKANKETFHLMHEDSEDAFFNTIRKENAQKVFDALDTGVTVQL